MNKLNLLSRAEMKKVKGGTAEDEAVGTLGKCTVKTNCSNGSVECSSDSGKCRKGSDYVQCDNDPYIYCR